MSAAARSSRDSWWRTAPVLTIAVLALIVSTAGGAYAVGKNSIGTQQLKKNAVTSSKIKNSTIASADVKNNTIASIDIRDGGVTGADVADGSLTTGDFAPGQLPSAPSRTYFAKVDAAGSLLARSPGVASVTKYTAGYYIVTLDFDPTRCAVNATASQAWRVVNTQPDTTHSVFVGAQELGAAMGAPYADTGFSLTIVC